MSVFYAFPIGELYKTDISRSVDRFFAVSIEIKIGWVESPVGGFVDFSFAYLACVHSSCVC